MRKDFDYSGFTELPDKVTFRLTNEWFDFRETRKKVEGGLRRTLGTITDGNPFLDSHGRWVVVVVEPREDKARSYAVPRLSRRGLETAKIFIEKQSGFLGFTFEQTKALVSANSRRVQRVEKHQEG